MMIDPAKFYAPMPQPGLVRKWLLLKVVRLPARLQRIGLRLLGY